jgi:hypothetical protein
MSYWIVTGFYWDKILLQASSSKSKTCLMVTSVSSAWSFFVPKSIETINPWLPFKKLFSSSGALLPRSYKNGTHHDNYFWVPFLCEGRSNASCVANNLSYYHMLLLCSPTVVMIRFGVHVGSRIGGWRNDCEDRKQYIRWHWRNLESNLKLMIINLVHVTCIEGIFSSPYSLFE